MHALNFDLLHKLLLSDQVKKRSERVVLTVSIISFLVHLSIIFLVDFGLLPFDKNSELLKSPIAAIYTPFSFILLYEVYLLIFYLPKSFTTYINKQYEIITLIIIRRLFKDLSNISLTKDWFKINYDLQLGLFYLIYLFNKIAKAHSGIESIGPAQLEGVARFIKIKKVLATILVPALVILSVYSFANWLIYGVFLHDTSAISFKNLNNIFFEQFFTILIIADVIVLLFSFFHTDEFHTVIRNSGFVISTILIRLSFSASGLINTLLILSSVVFGLVILVVYNQFESKKRER
jgi:hypothetical protein